MAKKISNDLFFSYILKQVRNELESYEKYDLIADAIKGDEGLNIIKPFFLTRFSNYLSSESQNDKKFKFNFNNKSPKIFSEKDFLSFYEKMKADPKGAETKTFGSFLMSDSFAKINQDIANHVENQLHSPKNAG